MTDIEFASKVAMYADSILRREVMESNSANFAELSDKMSKNILYASYKYIKEKGGKVKWLEDEIELYEKYNFEQKQEEIRKWVFENYKTKDGITYYGRKTI